MSLPASAVREQCVCVSLSPSVCVWSEGCLSLCSLIVSLEVREQLRPPLAVSR